MLVRYKLTGQLGNIPDDKFDNNLFEQVDPASVQQPQQNPNAGDAIGNALINGDLGSKIGNFVKDVGKSMVKPFANTYNRVGGAQYEVGRAAKMGIADLLNALGAKDAGLKLYQGASETNPYLKTEEDIKTATDPLQIAKDSAALISYGIPVGGATKIGGQVLKTGVFGGGALSGALQGFSNSGTTTESMLGNTLLGGAIGGISSVALNKLLGIGSKMKESGRAARESVLNPDVQDTPWAYADKQKMLDLQDASDALKGSSPKQQKALNDLWKEAQDDVTNAIKGKPGVTKKMAEDTLQETLKDTGYLGNRKAYQAYVSEAENRLKSSIGKAESINALKVKLRSELNPAFKKLTGGNANLTPSEEVKMSLFSTTKKLLETVAPDVGPLNSYEAQLFELAKGIGKQVSKEGGLSFPIIGRVGKEAMESVKDAYGRTLVGAGKSISSVPPLLQQVLSRGAPIVAANKMTEPAPKVQYSPDTTKPGVPDVSAPETNEANQGTITPEILMLGRATLTDEEYKKLKDIYDIQQTMSSSNTQGNRGALALKALFDSIQEQGLTAEGPGLGRLGGLKGSIATLTQSSPEAAAYQSIKSAFGTSMARASGEKGTMTDRDRKVIIDALPNFYDTSTTTSLKWKAFFELLNVMEEKYGMKNGTLQGILESVSE